MGGTRRCKDPDPLSKIIINCPRSLSRHAPREKWRRYGMARRLCLCKGYNKKLAMYVRRRTERVEIEGENCPYARQPPKRGDTPIAGPKPFKDRFGRIRGIQIQSRKDSQHALYHSRRPDHLVASGTGHFRHHGRLHPCAACDRHCYRLAQSHQRAQSLTGRSGCWSVALLRSLRDWRDSSARFHERLKALVNSPLPAAQRNDEFLLK